MDIIRCIQQNFLLIVDRPQMDLVMSREFGLEEPGPDEDIPITDEEIDALIDGLSDSEAAKIGSVISGLVGGSEHEEKNAQALRSIMEIGVIFWLTAAYNPFQYNSFDPNAIEIKLADGITLTMYWNDPVWCLGTDTDHTSIERLLKFIANNGDPLTINFPDANQGSLQFNVDSDEGLEKFGCIDIRMLDNSLFRLGVPNQGWPDAFPDPDPDTLFKSGTTISLEMVCAQPLAEILAQADPAQRHVPFLIDTDTGENDFSLGIVFDTPQKKFVPAIRESEFGVGPEELLGTPELKLGTGETVVLDPFWGVKSIRPPGPQNGAKPERPPSL